MPHESACGGDVECSPNFFSCATGTHGSCMRCPEDRSADLRITADDVRVLLRHLGKQTPDMPDEFADRLRCTTCSPPAATSAPAVRPARGGDRASELAVAGRGGRAALVI